MRRVGRPRSRGGRRRDARGRDRRGVRAVVQGEHRRPPGLAGHLDHAACSAEAGATVRAFDPTVGAEDADGADLSAPEVCDSAYEAVEGAHAIALLTEWAGVPLARLREDPLARGDARRSWTRGTSSTAASCTDSASRTGHRPAVRVVVAGGAGFLGSHLCDALLARGDEVVALDNLCTGSSATTSSAARRARLPVRRARRVGVAVEVDGAVDAVMNLASPGLAAGLPVAAARDAGRGRRRARGGCSSSRRADAARFVRPRRARSTATRPSTPSARTTGATSNPIGPAKRLRRVEAIRRGADRRAPPRARHRRRDRPDLQHLRAAARARATVVSSPTSSSRPSVASRSRSTATAPRRGASATSTTSCAGCSRCSTATSSGRSTSATRSSSRCSSSRDRVLHATGSDLDRSSTRPCPPTTRCVVAPTSRARAALLDWEPADRRSTRGWRGRSSTSGRSPAERPAGPGSLPLVGCTRSPDCAAAPSPQSSTRRSPCSCRCSTSSRRSKRSSRAACSSSCPSPSTSSIVNDGSSDEHGQRARRTRRPTRHRPRPSGQQGEGCRAADRARPRPRATSSSSRTRTSSTTRTTGAPCSARCSGARRRRGLRQPLRRQGPEHVRAALARQPVPVDRDERPVREAAR